MTSPRSSYSGGYYSPPPFPDTPIYDRLVAERGTPQIAPIRVPSAYDALPQFSSQPALPAALPALPSGPSAPQPVAHHVPPPQTGYQAPVRQPFQAAPAPQPAAPYIPQQASPARPYAPQAPQPPQQPQRYPSQAGRPAAPRPPAPRQAPGTYQDPYGQQHPYQYPGPGY
ncbi:DUF6643 family protein [Streptomyces sp. YIM 98790]|uniref:DUF6643 family protein n=1 Tax=Streptomyces sp. YIM 98790 TaxID=2689077 RepID=UPI00140AEFEF|nr:DUF6643 family protein [Streptomyces sp. YIM 98790]